MEHIYPNFYEVFPKPTDEGYVVLQCKECTHHWMYHIHSLNEETKCPYCGKDDSFDQFYYNAAENTYNYFQLSALKNLLSLINIEIDIIEQMEKDPRKKYQVNFPNNKKPTEQEMNEYVQLAFLELKKRVEEKSLKVIYKIFIQAKDLIDVEDFIEYKTPCCDKLLKIKYDEKDVKHCIYCKSSYE